MGYPYGAGTQPSGWTPAGAYNPIPAQPAYVVYQDPVTSQADSGRLIDQGTKQFVYTSAGNTQGMASVAQCVLIAWGTIDVRQQVPVFGAAWRNQIRSLYVNAVASLIGSKLLAINTFSAMRFGSNGARVHIKWTDLTTGIEYPYTTPPAAT